MCCPTVVIRPQSHGVSTAICYASSAMLVGVTRPAASDSLRRSASTRSIFCLMSAANCRFSADARSRRSRSSERASSRVWTTLTGKNGDKCCPSMLHSGGGRSVSAVCLCPGQTANFCRIAAAKECSKSTGARGGQRIAVRAKGTPLS